MDIIKKVFSNRKPSSAQLWLKANWRWLVYASIIILFIALLYPVMFRSWTKYPPSLRAELAWKSFLKTFEGPCREACLASRQAYADSWRRYFSTHKDEAHRYYAESLPGAPLELQAALIRIMAAEEGTEALPEILVQVIADETADAGIKKLIVSSFPEAFADEDWQGNLRVIATDPSAEMADRGYALGLLASFPDQENAQLMKEIIRNGSEAELVGTALDAVALWPEGTLRWSEDDLNELADSIKRDGSVLRWRRIWLLSGMGRGRAIVRILEMIAGDSALDNISRGLAAEALESTGHNRPNTPEPSEAEWQKYYEEI